MLRSAWHSKKFGGMRMRFSAMNFALALVLACYPAHGEGQAPSENRHNIEVQALNSPVKESLAKFKLLLPGGHLASEARFRLEYKREPKKDLQKVKFKRYEQWQDIALITTSDSITASFPAGPLPPDTFLIEFEVKTSKTWKNWISGIFRPSNEPELFRGKAEFQIDDSMEVPDPGEEGKATLAGIDSDSDGVRDDIQRWINENFSSSPNKRAGLKQSAHDFQATLLNTEDKTANIQAIIADMRSGECVDHVMGGIGNAIAVQDELKARMLNTRERNLAYFKSSENFNGQSYTLARRGQEGTRCRFPLSP